MELKRLFVYGLTCAILVPALNATVILECRQSVAGVEYKGTKNVTQTGIPCQRWDQQTPHSHTRTNPDRFPDVTLSDAENYCRNPDGEPTIWCYTVNNNTRWELCDVPMCEDNEERLRCR